MSGASRRPRCRCVVTALVLHPGATPRGRRHRRSRAADDDADQALHRADAGEPLLRQLLRHLSGRRRDPEGHLHARRSGARSRRATAWRPTTSLVPRSNTFTAPHTTESNSGSASAAGAAVAKSSGSADEPSSFGSSPGSSPTPLAAWIICWAKVAELVISCTRGPGQRLPGHHPGGVDHPLRRWATITPFCRNRASIAASSA